MNNQVPMVPFTDQEVDNLLLTAVPVKTDSESKKLWSLGECLVFSPFSPPHYQMNNMIVHKEYKRLIATISIEAFKKIISQNNSILTYVFDDIAYSTRDRSRNLYDLSGVKTPFELERIQLIDWIIEQKLYDVREMLQKLVRVRLLDQCKRIFHDPSLSIYDIWHSFSNDFGIIWDTADKYTGVSEYLQRENEFIDLYLKDPRLDPGEYGDNRCLADAVYRKNLFLINRLLADPRVQACKKWSRVVENAFWIGTEEICRLILDQPNAKITRNAMFKCSERENFDWVKSHPKYPDNLYVLKKPSEIIASIYGNETSNYMYSADRRVRDLNLHANDEVRDMIYHVIYVCDQKDVKNLLLEALELDDDYEDLVLIKQALAVSKSREIQDLLIEILEAYTNYDHVKSVQSAIEQADGYYHEKKKKSQLKILLRRLRNEPEPRDPEDGDYHYDDNDAYVYQC